MVSLEHDPIQKANFHTHTWRCNHATGTEREYIETAIEAGFCALGFSDHAPYFFPGDYYSTFRMRPELLEDYVTTLSKLKDEYKKDIQIYIGLETEYYPDCFDKLTEFLKDYPIEYMLLAQHFLHNEYDGTGSGNETTDEGLLIQYTDQLIAGMETGRFLYVAHPDFFHYVGDESVYRREVRRLAKTAKRLNIPLEINLQGLWMRRHYPNELFWDEVARAGAQAVIGSDAHSPEVVTMPEQYKEACALAAKYGVTHRREESLTIL